MLCGSWIRLSRCQRKRSRLLPRPSKRLIQLGSPGCVGKKKVYFSAAATSKGGKDGDEPPALPACPDGAPGPASLPAAWPGVCGVSGPCQGGEGPQLVCRGQATPGQPPELTEPGQGTNGTAPHGQAPTAALGTSPAPESEGTGSASPLPTEIRLSVCLWVTGLGGQP